MRGEDRGEEDKGERIWNEMREYEVRREIRRGEDKIKDERI